MIFKKKRSKENPDARFLVLGMGCDKCEKTWERLKEAVEKLRLEGEISKIESIPTMMRYGILVTPSIVMDGRVIYSKDIAPGEEELEELLKEENGR